MVGMSPVTNENCYHDKFMPTTKFFQWHGASGCHMFKENAKVLIILLYIILSCCLAPLGTCYKLSNHTCAINHVGVPD